MFAVVQLILCQKTLLWNGDVSQPHYSLLRTGPPRSVLRHPTWRRAVPVWRNRTRRHRRLDAYADGRTDERESEVTSVAPLGSSFLLRDSRIRLHLQQWNSLTRATRAARFLTLNLVRRLAELSNSDVEASSVSFLWSDCHLRCVSRLGAIVPQGG